jgi:uncharacterized membrane protein YgaE (UPF0421/DUF939 family)
MLRMRWWVLRVLGVLLRILLRVLLGMLLGILLGVLLGRLLHQLLRVVRRMWVVLNGLVLLVCCLLPLEGGPCHITCTIGQIAVERRRGGVLLAE